MSSLSVAFVFG